MAVRSRSLIGFILKCHFFLDVLPGLGRPPSLVLFSPQLQCPVFSSASHQTCFSPTGITQGSAQAFWSPHLHTPFTIHFRIYPRVPQAPLPASYLSLRMPKTFGASLGACPTFASHSTYNLESQHHYCTEGIPDSWVCCQDPPGLALINLPSHFFLIHTQVWVVTLSGGSGLCQLS